MRRFRWLLLLLALACTAVAPAPLDGWRSAGPTLRFVGQDLYGHINGGAELFHEFGFRDLRVEDWEDEAGLQISLETYRMSDPRAALGIYLALCGREKPLADFPHRNTANPWQLTACRGDHFVQVNNFAGGEERLPVMRVLAERALAEAIDAPAEPLLDLLAESWPGRPLPGSRHLLRGPLALQPLLSLPGDNALGLGAATCGVTGRFLQQSGVEQITVIALQYQHADSAQAVFGRLATDPSRVRHGTGDADFSDYEFHDPQGRDVSLRLQGRRLRILIQ
jgi:hypothetical protein